jgi:DNA-binding transcriptional LysR family regulator
MNTKQIKLFLLIADLKSFSRAAELEALTQPAVTQQIMRLEKEIDSQLFRRKHKRIELTRKGKLFYKFAKNTTIMMDNLQKEIKQLDLNNEGILKIGSSHIPVANVIHKNIARFNRMYPGSYVIYEFSDTANITNMLEDELIDIGFVGAGISDALDYTKFMGDELVLVARKDFDIPSEITLSELKSIPLIINQKEAGVRKSLEEKLGASNTSLSELNVVSEIGLPEAALNVIKEGFGCTFIPSVMLDGHENKDELKVIKIKNFNASRNYYIAVKKGVVLPEIARHFLDLLTQEKKPAGV